MAAEDSVDVQDLIAMFRRRRSIVFRTVSICLITAAVFAIGIPSLYRSDGTIMIERAEISGSLVRPTYDRDLDTNLLIQRISDAVLTQDTLESVVAEFDLYPDLRESGSSNAAIRELRSSIKISALTAEDMPLGSDNDETVAFKVMFLHSDPEMARDVTRHLIQLYTEEHRRRRTEVARSTIQFIEAEAKKLEIRISEIENALADFKQKHAGALPELMDMNLQVMERTERELELVERDIRNQQQAISLLDADLAQIDPSVTVFTEDGRPVQGSAERLQLLEREYIRISSLYSPEHPDRIRLKREIDQLRASGSSPSQRQALLQEISSNRAELRILKERYSEDHPDVTRLERLIAEAETQLATLPPAAASSIRAEPTNPEYINARLRLSSAEQELSALVSRRIELRRKLQTLESQIMLTPQVEREYRELTRDYENAVDKYNEIKDKQNLAQINLSLETEQKGERFVVYKNADFPSAPIRPNRPLIVALAIALAVTASVGLVVVMEALDATMRGKRDVQEIWDAPPIAVVPYVYNSADRVAQLARVGLTAIALVLWAGGLFASLQLIY